MSSPRKYSFPALGDGNILLASTSCLLRTAYSDFLRRLKLRDRRAIAITVSNNPLLTVIKPCRPAELLTLASHSGLACFDDLISLPLPAFAQSFYVVQDVKTKKCTITETKPTSSEVTVGSGDSVYKTKTEAEAGMKTVKVCTTN